MRDALGVAAIALTAACAQNAARATCRKEHVLERGKSGHWLPGVSGNPKGRKPGSTRHKLTEACEKRCEESALEVIEAAIASAKAGDAASIKLVLAYAIQRPSRDRSVAWHLPPINSAADVVSASAAVMQSCSEGLISPAEANILVQSLATHAKILEVNSNAEQYTALEAEVRAIKERQEVERSRRASQSRL